MVCLFSFGCRILTKLTYVHRRVNRLKDVPEDLVGCQSLLRFERLPVIYPETFVDVLVTKRYEF